MNQDWKEVWAERCEQPIEMQFCSDWLKEQIQGLCEEAARLREENQVLRAGFSASDEFAKIKCLELKQSEEKREKLRGALEATKTTFQSLFLVAQEAHISLPMAKIVSMPLADFRALRELGHVIAQCQNAAEKIGVALAADEGGE